MNRVTRHRPDFVGGLILRRAIARPVVRQQSVAVPWIESDDVERARCGGNGGALETPDGLEKVLERARARLRVVQLGRNQRSRDGLCRLHGIQP